MNYTNSDKPVRLVNYAIRSAIASGLMRPRPTLSHVVPEIVDEIVADFPECVSGQRSFARDEMITLFSGG